MKPPLEIPLGQHGPTRTIASLEVQQLCRALRLNSAGLSAEGAKGSSCRRFCLAEKRQLRLWGNDCKFDGGFFLKRWQP